MENRRADALNRGSNYIETKEKFDTSILKINKVEALLAN